MQKFELVFVLLFFVLFLVLFLTLIREIFLFLKMHATTIWLARVQLAQMCLACWIRGTEVIMANGTVNIIHSKNECKCSTLHHTPDTV